MSSSRHPESPMKPSIKLSKSTKRDLIKLLNEVSGLERGSDTYFLNLKRRASILRKKIEKIET
jgi:hypothetical protein